MNIAEFSIKNKVITIVITVVLFLGGAYSYTKLGRLEDPEFTVKAAKVTTQYSGASAMEVAEEVTDKIETAIQQLGEVDYVKSLSTPGLSSVHVELKKETRKEEISLVWEKLQSKIDEIQQQLPPGTNSSIVWDDYGDVYGIFYAIYGDGFSYAELKDYAKLLKRELSLVKDVAKVELYGSIQEVVYIEISRSKLAQLGLSPEVIYASLAGENIVVPSGNIKVGSKYIRIAPTGMINSIQDIGNILIIQSDKTASKLYIRDIAKISRGYQDPPAAIMHYNGMPAIGIGISTAKGGNVVLMGQAISKRVEELKSQTPIGIEIGTIAHQSDTVVASINGFVIGLAESVAIVIGVLVFAMGFRSGILMGGILLLTVLATFILMKIHGVMLERISLGAMIIALGMLVDNAIVIVEGILVNSQKGMDKVKAAAAIVGQTALPLFGATLIAVMAFAGIGLSSDSTGEYCGSLFYVILYSLMLSWVLAISITPYYSVVFLKNKKQDGEIKDPYKGKLFQLYKKILIFCINKRWLTIIILAILLVISIIGFRFVDQSFFPNSTRPQFMVHYWLPQGTHISKTDTDIKNIENAILKFDGVKEVAGFAGQGCLRFLLTYTPEESNTAYGLILVSVDNYKKIPKLTKQVQDYIKQNYPQAESFCRNFSLGPGDPFKIQARFTGQDPEILRELAFKAQKIMSQTPGAADINIDWRQKVPIIRPIIAEAQTRNAGLTRKEISDAIKTSTEGFAVGIYRENDELLPIVVRNPEKERINAADIKNAQVFSPVSNSFISAGQFLVRLETESENQIIRRRNRVSTIIVRCDPMDEPASKVLLRMKSAIESIELPMGYSLEWGGEYEDSQKASAALMAKIPVVFLLMVLIVIFLFNSIKKPLIIFLTVPLAVIGVTAGLLITNQPFGFMALLGFLSLSGMLIKNSIVLIDEINMQLASNKNPFDAIVDSGISRVRPVSMAALTTVLGMIPLLADAFFISMAVTIMAGLTFATVLTLVVVPVFYCVFYKIKQ